MVFTITAGATASKCNECIKEDRGDDEKYRACCDIALFSGSIAGY